MQRESPSRVSSILALIELVSQCPLFTKLIQAEFWPFATQSPDLHSTESDVFSGGFGGGREGTQMRLKTWMEIKWAPAKVHLSPAHLPRGILKFSHSIHCRERSVSLHFSSQSCFLQGSSPHRPVVAGPAVRRGPEDQPPSQRAHSQLFWGCYQPNLHSESPASVGSPVGGVACFPSGLPCVRTCEWRRTFNKGSWSSAPSRYQGSVQDLPEPHLPSLFTHLPSWATIPLGTIHPHAT